MVTPADDEAMPVQTNFENLDFFVLFLCSHLGTIKNDRFVLQWGYRIDG